MLLLFREQASSQSFPDLGIPKMSQNPRPLVLVRILDLIPATVESHFGNQAEYPSNFANVFCSKGQPERRAPI
jgi:hypothetical protein